jgi:hypothetical protein
MTRACRDARSAMQSSRFDGFRAPTTCPGALVFLLTCRIRHFRGGPEGVLRKRGRGQSCPPPANAEFWSFGVGPMRF